MNTVLISDAVERNVPNASTLSCDTQSRAIVIVFKISLVIPL